MRYPHGILQLCPDVSSSSFKYGEYDTWQTCECASRGRWCTVFTDLPSNVPNFLEISRISMTWSFSLLPTSWWKGNTYQAGSACILSGFGSHLKCIEWLRRALLSNRLWPTQPTVLHICTHLWCDGRPTKWPDLAIQISQRSSSQQTRLPSFFTLLMPNSILLRFLHTQD